MVALLFMVPFVMATGRRRQKATTMDQHAFTFATPGGFAADFAGRRGFLAGLAVAAAAVPQLGRSATVPAGRPVDRPGDWAEFRLFVTPEGRVIDTGNGNIPHSGGQGAALLLAARNDDGGSFERILAWTRGALRRPDDTLLA